MRAYARNYGTFSDANNSNKYKITGYWTDASGSELE